MTETVSSYFLRRVPERGAGEVHSVFRSSLNVMAEGFLVHLGGGDAPLSCLGINMDPGRMGALLPRVRPGDRAVFRDGTLRIYDREGVSLIPYREFATVPLELPRCSPPPPSLLRALEDLGLEDRVGIPVDSRLETALATLRQPSPPEDRLAETIGFLAGRGKGLTPSGDDILMGYGAGLWAWGEPGPFCHAMEKVLRSQRTTDVSAAYLAALREGCANRTSASCSRRRERGRKPPSPPSWRPSAATATPPAGTACWGCGQRSRPSPRLPDRPQISVDILPQLGTLAGPGEQPF